MNIHDLKDNIDTLEKIQKDKVKALRLAKKELLRFESSVEKELSNISTHKLDDYSFANLKTNLDKELTKCLSVLSNVNCESLIKQLKTKLQVIKDNINE